MHLKENDFCRLRWAPYIIREFILGGTARTKIDCVNIGHYLKTRLNDGFNSARVNNPLDILGIRESKRMQIFALIQQPAARNCSLRCVRRDRAPRHRGEIARLGLTRDEMCVRHSSRNSVGFGTDKKSQCRF